MIAAMIASSCGLDFTSDYAPPWKYSDGRRGDGDGGYRGFRSTPRVPRRIL